jgi:hypothetical protein
VSDISTHAASATNRRNPGSSVLRFLAPPVQGNPKMTPEIGVSVHPALDGTKRTENGDVSRLLISILGDSEHDPRLPSEKIEIGDASCKICEIVVRNELSLRAVPIATRRTRCMALLLASNRSTCG